MHLLSHLKGKLHSDAVRRVHDGREPNRDELQKFNIAQIKDLQNSAASNSDSNRAAKEKQKALKRRSRKIKQRMTARSQDYEGSVKSGSGESGGGVQDSANKAKLRRNLKELDKLCQSHAKTTWSVVTVASLERHLGEIARTFSKAVRVEFVENSCV